MCVEYSVAPGTIILKVLKEPLWAEVSEVECLSGSEGKICAEQPKAQRTDVRW